jgi:hypothetical protein
LHAEPSYFLACEDGKIIDTQDRDKTIIFKKGDLFEVANQGSGRIKSVNKYKEGAPKKLDSFSKSRSECWSDSGDPICPLIVVYTTTQYKHTYDHSGFLELKSGCWFKSEKKIPIKDKTSKDFLGEIGSILKDPNRAREEIVEKTLDKEFVDVMCSPHATQFSVAGNMLTDIKMEKSEKHLKWVEKDRLYEEARNERIRQEEEAKEESARLEREEQRILQEKQEAELRDWKESLRKKYGVEKVVGINLLEVNPYEFEGHTIAVVVQFQKMLSKTSAIFFSGYTNLSDSTGVPDQIIITGIPKGTHFKSGFMAPRMMLALKGKGTIDGTNAFGAKIQAPHFQWIGIISGEQKSVFEEQRDISRENALQNMRNSRPNRAQ